MTSHGKKSKPRYPSSISLKPGGDFRTVAFGRLFKNLYFFPFADIAQLSSLV